MEGCVSILQKCINVSIFSKSSKKRLYKHLSVFQGFEIGSGIPELENRVKKQVTHYSAIKLR